MTDYISQEKSTKNLQDDILRALDRGSKLIGSTMGPGGRYVTIATNQGPITTKDGVSVARYMNFESQLDRLIAQMIITASQKTVEEVGDGTTTAAILLKALYEELLKHPEVKEAAANMFEVSKGIECAVSHIEEFLKENAHQIIKEGSINFEYLKNIATISANNNKALGELIAGLIKKVGINGSITLRDSNTSETYCEHFGGYTFPTTVLAFGKQYNKGTIEMENPVFLIIDKQIDDFDQISEMLGCWKSQMYDVESNTFRPLVLIMSDISGLAKSTIIANAKQFPVIAIKAPDFVERRQALLEDIQFLTDTRQIFSDITGHTLERFGVEIEGEEYKEFGSASRIVIRHDRAIIVTNDDEDFKKEINERISDLKSQEDSLEDPARKAFLKERISRLSSGVGVIYVGADTDPEQSAKKDLVDDAYKACFAALKGGVIGGGGNSLLRASIWANEEELKAKYGLNVTQMIGFSAVIKAIQAPFYKILRNQHIYQSTVKDIITRHYLTSEYSRKNFFNGFLLGEGMTSLVKAGVLDPCDVTVAALRNSASVVKNLICTEFIVFTNPRSTMPDLETLVSTAKYLGS